MLDGTLLVSISECLMDASPRVATSPVAGAAVPDAAAKAVEVLVLQ